MFPSNSPYSPFFTSGLLSHSIFDAIWRPNPDNSKHHPEFTSFLSLDLSESPSMRSASLEQKPSVSTRFSRISETDSLRSLPSPKPAPSATLPDVPDSPPRIPSLPPVLALEIPLSTPAPSLTISRTPTPLTAIRRLSVATKATSSSVSTRVRRSNRSEALACLEGRSKRVSYPLHSKHQQYNFMNMSDDEDEDDTDLAGLNFDHVFSNPVLEPEDVVLPTSFLQAPRSAPLPSQYDSFLFTPSLPVRPNKTQVPSTKDWLPLTSFIDLHNDDDSSSWTWRSFIQVANIS